MNFKKLGFTLAEMLITLSVIGIVAALTIPGLVKNHNEKAWATAQDVFTKKLEIAMKAMNTDGTLTGYSTTANFVNALKKNIKITKVCTDDVTKCFSKEVIWNEGEEPVEVTNTAVQYDNNQGQDWAETVGVQFANGVTALIAYNKNCSPDPYNNQQAVTGQCVGIIYDVSANKNPNTNGKDIASNANVSKLRDSSGCLILPSLLDGEMCISKILKPGIDYLALDTSSTTSCDDAKSQYGLSYCSGRNDWYAGAASVCGGKSKLPSKDQLHTLATYLYDGATIKNSSGVTTSNVQLNTTKAAPFLAQSSYSDKFYIWSRTEVVTISTTTRYGANSRFFSSTETGSYDAAVRTQEDRLAVCLGEW